MHFVLLNFTDFVARNFTLTLELFTKQTIPLGASSSRPGPMLQKSERLLKEEIMPELSMQYHQFKVLAQGMEVAGSILWVLCKIIGRITHKYMLKLLLTGG